MNKQLKEKIYNNYSITLFSFYKELDWEFDPITGTFYKSEFKVSCRPSAEYSNHLVFRPYLSVKSRVISEILNQIFPDTPIYNVVGRGQSKELASYMGVDWSCDYVNENDNYYYSIYEDTDIRPIVSDHCHYMEQVGFSFFDSFSTLEKIDAFINDRIIKNSLEDFQKLLEKPIEEKKWLDFYNVTGAYYGLVCAFLIKNKNIKDIINHYLLLYSNYPVLEDFEKLINHLETNYS